MGKLEKEGLQRPGGGESQWPQTPPPHTHAHNSLEKGLPVTEGLSISTAEGHEAESRKPCFAYIPLRFRSRDSAKLLSTPVGF